MKGTELMEYFALPHTPADYSACMAAVAAAAAKIAERLGGA